jgi:spore germination protein YaaH
MMGRITGASWDRTSVKNFMATPTLIFTVQGNSITLSAKATTFLAGNSTNAVNFQQELVRDIGIYANFLQQVAQVIDSNGVVLSTAQPTAVGGTGTTGGAGGTGGTGTTGGTGGAGTTGGTGGTGATGAVSKVAVKKS